MLASWSCCTRQDGSKYPQPCACPSAQLITKSSSKTATLCGFSEFIGFESSPVKKYRKLTYSHNEAETRWNCYEATDQYLVDYSITNIYTATREYDQSDCSVSDNEPGFVVVGQSFSFFQDFDDDLVIKECSPGLIIQSRPYVQIGSSNITRDQGVNEPDANYTLISAVSAQYNTSFSEVLPVDGVGDCTFCDGKKTVDRQRNRTADLSIEDTEDDALARATPAIAESMSSIYQLRTTGFSFTVRTVDYCLLCTGLVVGKSYNGSIPKQSREAVIGSTDIWSDESSDTFTFTAVKSFHIEGGALNESITDQDFIDQDYSLNPTDYGLSAAEDVIIPETELDNVRGYEFVIGSNASGDPLYIEAN